MTTFTVLPHNHWLWYIAQISLGGSFIAPSLLVLRALLSTGFLFLFVWSIAELHVSVDSAVFAGTYMIINAIQFCRLLWARRHVSFDEDRETVYMNYFGPEKTGSKKWSLSRVAWLGLVKDASIKTVPKGGVLARKGDRCETLSFLLSGGISYEAPDLNGVTQERIKIHSVEQYGVIDAVEFIHRETYRGAVWGIDAVATCAVRLLVIPYSVIDRESKGDMLLGPTLNAICGVQVSTMLFNAEAERIHSLLSGKELSPRSTIPFGFAPNSLPPPHQHNAFMPVQPGVQPLMINQKQQGTEMIRYHIEDQQNTTDASV